MDQKQIVLSADAARQGVTGHGVRYVLGFGMLFAICALGTVLMFAR